MSVIFDAGALIAVERNDRSVWSVVKRAALDTVDVVVPSTVLAQVWRGAPRQARLGALLRFCVVASFDELAFEVGVLCGRAGVRDICDAHVALVASRRGGALYTSDPDDIRGILQHVPGPPGRRRRSERLQIVRC